MSPYSCRIYRTETDEDGNTIYISMKPKIITVDNVTDLEFSTDHFSEYVVTETILSEDIYNDDTNGVEISGVFPLGTKITVVKTESDDKNMVYIIAAEDESGNAIILDKDNAATVKIKLTENWNMNEGKITVKLDDTVIEAFEIKDGYVSFKTVSFGMVILSYVPNETGEETTTDNTTSGGNNHYPSFAVPETTTVESETITTPVEAETTTTIAEIETSTTTINDDTTKLASTETPSTATTFSTVEIEPTTSAETTIVNANSDSNVPTGNVYAAIIPIIAFASGITIVAVYNRKKK